MNKVEVIKASARPTNRMYKKTLDRLRVAAYCRVSTDNEEQLSSYNSQVQHYSEYIEGQAEWVLAGVYADEAITGTQTKKREDFQRLIHDCMNGDIDLVITKSISRFARNTLDTLKYVRMLKEKNVGVLFEEENINTLTMDGEPLLVILSSVAQQEVENISANVKKGLKMKMQRGELVGFQGCLGYDYDTATKTILINHEEAEIVRYIFQRYVEGMGCHVIGQELERNGWKTKRGNTSWFETTVMGVIKNEKYKGDILLGKTFTLDPISKRRLANFGEEDQFYIRNHHEPIISEEVFDAAQQIVARRGASYKQRGKPREKYSRQFAFSSMLECGFCGSNLSRRCWHSGTKHNKVIWHCVTSTQKGKKHCPDSKGICESTIEQAFLESYRLLCHNNKGIMEELLTNIENALRTDDSSKELSRCEKEIQSIVQKRKKLLDMRLEGGIDKESYDSKHYDLTARLSKLTDERAQYQDSATHEANVKKRVLSFRKVLEQTDTFTEFDRHVFECVIEKVIVGGFDDKGNAVPDMLAFVYRTGHKDSVKGNKFKPERRNGKTAKLCSDTMSDIEKSCSAHGVATCGDCCIIVQTKINHIH